MTFKSSHFWFSLLHDLKILWATTSVVKKLMEHFHLPRNATCPSISFHLYFRMFAHFCHHYDVSFLSIGSSRDLKLFHLLENCTLFEDTWRLLDRENEGFVIPIFFDHFIAYKNPFISFLSKHLPLSNNFHFAKNGKSTR